MSFKALVLSVVAAVAAMAAQYLFLSVSTEAVGPANDDFGTASNVSEPLPFVDTVPTDEATSESGEPSPCAGIANTVWYAFTPSVSGVVIADTLASDFDTALAAYTGTDLKSLSLIDCNDDSGSLASLLVLWVEQSTTYYFQAGGYQGATGNVSFSVAWAGSISGTVTDEGSGDPLAGICVNAWPTSGPGGGFSLTDGSGNYTITGLIGGDHRVAYYDCANEPDVYAPEYYDDKPDWGSADPVPVLPGLTTAGIDAALSVGGSISGTVTDEVTGDPLANMCVSASAYPAPGDGFALTDGSGNYTIGGLPGGEYRVSFHDCTNYPIIYATEYYDDHPNWGSADLVPVSLGSATEGVDAALGRAGGISGTVTDEGTGDPLQDICVAARTEAEWWWGVSLTSSDGSYAMNWLPEGDYSIEFYDCNFGVYENEWYNDKPTFLEADPVHVTAGENTAGIDAALARMSSISGTVTDEASGDPLADMCVSASAYPASGYGFAVTDGSGNYTIGGLPAGDYKVQFWDCANSPVVYVREFFDDRPDWDGADLVSVSPGGTTVGIDAALAVGGSISGTVRDESSGDPLADMCVSASAYPASGYGFAVTDGSGNYTIGGLPAGDYKVQFWDCANSPMVWVQEFFDDKPDWDSADAVSVSLGATTPGIDAALAVGGSISGTVTDEATGDPLQDICVSAYPIAEGSGGWATTDVSGTYTIGGLQEGDYRVYFFDCNYPGVYAGEYYDDEPDWDSADPVHVTLGDATAGIDAALALAGTATPTPSPTFTDTPTPTFTETPAPTFTETPTPTVTATASPTETPTATPTETPPASAPATPCPESEPTDGCESPSPSLTASPTPTPTVAPTAPPTEEPTATPSPTDTLTPTPSPTAGSTAEPTATIILTESPTSPPTAEPTPTPTLEPTPTPTLEPTPTPALEPTPTVTPVPSGTVGPATETPRPCDTEAPSTATPRPTKARKHRHAWWRWWFPAKSYHGAWAAHHNKPTCTPVPTLGPTASSEPSVTSGPTITQAPTTEPTETPRPCKKGHAWLWRFTWGHGRCRL